MLCCVSDMLLKIQEKLFRSIFRYLDKDTIFTYVITKLDTDNTAPKKINKMEKNMSFIHCILGKR